MEFLGTVSNIRFHSEENFFTVADIETEDGNITVTGSMPMINIGDDIKIQGDIVYHPKYGEQINGKKIIKVMPNTPDRILKYLSSGIIPFVGKKTAKKIVDLYGEKSLEVISKDESSLLKIDGIGKKKAEKIRNKILEESAQREIVIFLQGLGLGTKQSLNIYKKYKEDTILKIQENPYGLIDDISGISFIRADQIALKNGLKKDSPYRIKAGIEYVLKDEAYTNGNIYLLKDHLIERLRGLLSLNEEFFTNPLFDLELEGKIKFERENNRIYLNSFYTREKNIGRKLVEISEGFDLDRIEIDPNLDIFKELKLSKDQMDAIDLSINNKMAIITGGPGTGKTTIIRAIIEIFEKEKITYQLAAPTGRAAKRMEESTNKKAQTIHRLLGYKGIDNENLMEYNEDNLIESDCLIIDETSMIDINLLDNLLKAVDDTIRLIFVGDIDQLPSVGPGNVLGDMIKSKIIPLVKLNKIYRQNEDSNIVVNAHRINKGLMPIVNKEGGGFYLLRERTEEDSLNTILDLIKKRLPKNLGIDRGDIQVLSPMKRGLCGVSNLNEKIQGLINPEKIGRKEIEYKENIFRVNDKVMQIKNNYNLEYDGKEEGKGVYNGDFGIIKDIDHINEKLEVIYDDEKLVTYDYNDLGELSLSYAITIHKSQGSEFPCVIIPIVPGPYMLLTKNIIYTAITRAKKLVILVGSEEILQKMIGNTREVNRNTSLDERIIEYKQILDGLKWN